MEELEQQLMGLGATLVTTDSNLKDAMGKCHETKLTCSVWLRYSACSYVIMSTLVALAGFTLEYHVSVSQDCLSKVCLEVSHIRLTYVSHVSCTYLVRCRCLVRCRVTTTCHHTYSLR